MQSEIYENPQNFLGAQHYRAPTINMVRQKDMAISG